MVLRGCCMKEARPASLLRRHQTHLEPDAERANRPRAHPRGFASSEQQSEGEVSPSLTLMRMQNTSHRGTMQASFLYLAIQPDKSCKNATANALRAFGGSKRPRSRTGAVDQLRNGLGRPGVSITQ